MHFRISDTFTDSLTKLTGQEQKAVKTTAFDLQLDPAGPGMKFHRIDRAKDPNFWSVRVNADIRLIVHKTASSLLLCYVDHHDDAYRWAERRRIETHPKTGAAQLVVIPETEGQPSPPPTLAPAADIRQERHYPPVFLNLGDEQLLGVGVPEGWCEAVRNATEDTILDLGDDFPQEALEALIEFLASGELKPWTPPDTTVDPFQHPDAQRRFRVVENVEELERALDYPWERWTVFLHPAQRHFVETEYSGPARISGSAGTGKTVVALHRAVFLARRHPDARILLTTFSDTLANTLRVKLDRLVGNEREVRGRIKVCTISGIGRELYAAAFGEPNIASDLEIRHMLISAAGDVEGTSISTDFLYAEWDSVVDAWQLETWEGYRDVARLGRKTRIGGKQRERLWAVFQQVRDQLREKKLITNAQVFATVTDHMSNSAPTPFRFTVVDEAQDIGIAELRFLAAIGSAQPDSLFFAGDLGQRIFQQPFSWKALGVDIRGRSHTLRINYRTSHQIRRQADLLLPGAMADVDGVEESRKGTVSVFNGPAPDIQICDDENDEIERVGAWLMNREVEGVQPQEIGVFVRSRDQIGRAFRAVDAAGYSAVELTDKVNISVDEISIGTMHLAKGLEFKSVVVMACDDAVLPLQSRVEKVTDMSDLDDVYNTERHLLYVACTRARDHLLVTGVDPASEFLDDLIG